MEHPYMELLRRHPQTDQEKVIYAAVVQCSTQEKFRSKTMPEIYDYLLNEANTTLAPKSEVAAGD